MRTHGTLTKWNDDRGFGFVTRSEGCEEIFVHISEFPHDNVRPRLHEVISFEIEEGQNGKPRAVRVMRPGSQARTRIVREQKTATPKRGVARTGFVFLAFAAIVTYGYSRFSDFQFEYSNEPVPVSAQAATVSAHKCDGRTMCSQMTSCAEATYFLKHCPNTKMDGDNDGEPCEQQWCN